MANCQICHTSGSNMHKCTKCGSVWCWNCVTKGIYPGVKKTHSGNVCPVCGALNSQIVFR